MLDENAEPAETSSVNEMPGTTRPSCPFGHKCYRQSTAHRSAMAHLGDQDFKVDTQHLIPAEDAPDCPYGLNCYRLNPVHFRDYKHPPEIDVSENYKNHYLNRVPNRIRRRRRNQGTTNSQLNLGDSEEDEFFDEEEDEDPFAATDSDDETYIPSYD